MDSGSAFSVKKVQKRSTEAQAADRLREAILEGDIPLGSRLTEILMSEQVGVSRGTIRTAFHQLVQEGLLVQVPYTGWTVMTLSSHDAWELYTLRASLEALASRLVALRVRNNDPDGRVAAALRSAYERLKAACAKRNNHRAIAQEDMNLHKSIVALAQHGRLRDQYSLIEHQARIYIRSSDELVQDPADILSQHAPIIDTLLRGDEKSAVEAAAAHNEREGTILFEHLKRLELQAR